MAALSYSIRRSWSVLILLLILAGLVADCFKGPLGLHDLMVLKRHQASLEATRDALLADNSRLSDEATRLQSDPRYIAEMIRRELGYARSDELVYRFANPSTAP
jgi:cell division protein FtsB